jgi:peptidoglycan-associated lipoprotein
MNYMFSRITLLSLVVGLAALISACASPTAKLTVSNKDIKPGEAVTVKWETKNSKLVELNGEKVEKTGGKSVAPKETTKYEIVAKRGKKTARDSATVIVTVVKPPTPTVTIRADQSSLERGQNTKIRWESTNARNVTITGLGEVAVSGDQDVSPRVSTTYTATAMGEGGNATSSVRVSVTDPPAPEPPPAPPVVVKDPTPPIADQFRNAVRPVFFDYDKSELLPPEQDKLRQAAEWLNLDRNRSIAFRLEGNCDPRGTSEYNLGLGDRRARAVKDFLVSLGVDPNRIETVSYGSEKAQGLEEGTTNVPPSWAYDRRADPVYLRGGDKP